MEHKTHMLPQSYWADRSLEDEQLHLGFDVISQLELPLSRRGWTRKELAKHMGVSQGRVSQIFNSPESLRVSSISNVANALDMCTAIVIYPRDEGDTRHISGHVFRRCWELLGSPTTEFGLSSSFRDMQLPIIEIDSDGIVSWQETLPIKHAASPEDENPAQSHYIKGQITPSQMILESPDDEIRPEMNDISAEADESGSELAA